jgi:hypothetical protein
LQRKPVFHPLTRILIFASLTLTAFVAVDCKPFLQSAQSTPQPVTIQDVVVHEAFSNQVWTANWTLEEGGVKIYDPSQAGLGFVRPADRYTPPGQLPQNEEFHLRPGEPLLLHLVVNAAQSSTFLLTVLLDYQQIPFTLDGQYGLLHEIKVKSEDGASAVTIYIPAQITIGGPGAHDLIIMAFNNPHNRPWNHEARDLVFGCNLHGRRTVVIVGDSSRPVQEIMPDVYGAAPPAKVDFGLRVMFADMPASPIDTTHPSERQMCMTAHGEAGGTFRYQLWLSNYELPDDTVNYGLMRFLDFHQIDFKGKDLFVAHFDGRQEAITEDSLVLPTQLGIHELQIVYVFDPYKSVLRGEVLAPFIFSSSCLGIEAR